MLVLHSLEPRRTAAAGGTAASGGLRAAARAAGKAWCTSDSRQHAHSFAGTRAPLVTL